MTDQQTLADFATLFAGRDDVHGAWTGACVPNDLASTFGLISNHLHNGPYIGIYPLLDDNTVRWGCVDIDGKDHHADWEAMWDIAATLQDVLSYKDCTSWLERTANGIHLWVFADEPVPAVIMRHALLVACQVADYHPKEVNPKQTEVTDDKPYGNYVRLPYYGYFTHGMPTDRFIVSEDGEPMTLEWWSRSAMGSRNDMSTLKAMADLYVPPAPKERIMDMTELEAQSEFTFLYPILPPVVKMIYDDGPLNADRSAALVKTAVILRDEGWRAQAVMTVLIAIDGKLGKFVDRPDRFERLAEIIDKVGAA